MTKLSKKIIAVILCIATVFCTIVSAYGYSAIGDFGVETSSFWGMLSKLVEKEASDNNIPTFFDSFAITSYKNRSPGCPNNADGHLWYNPVDPVDVITGYSPNIRCRYCNVLYTDYCAQQYSSSVDTLPASAVTSNNTFIWHPSLANLSSFKLGLIHKDDYNSSTLGSCLINSEGTVVENNVTKSCAWDGSQFNVSLNHNNGSALCDNFTYRNFHYYFSYNFNAPVAGTYASIACPSVSGTYIQAANGARGSSSCSYSNSNIGYFNANDAISCGSSKSGARFDIGSAPVGNHNSIWNIKTLIASFYLPTFEITPVQNYFTGSNPVYYTENRVGAFSGNYIYTGNNGQQIIGENISIVNEGDKTIYNPVTETTYVYNTYNYDYSTRTYDLTTTDNKKVVVNFGDNALTMNVNGVEYTLSYTTQYAHEHSYEIVEEIAATCTSAGIVKRRCTQCGDIHITNLDAYGHDWICTGYVIDSNGDTVPVTNSDLASNTDLSNQQSGYYVFTCTRCGAVNREYVTGKPTDSPVYTGGIFSILNRIVVLLESVDAKIFDGLPAYPTSVDNSSLLRMIYNALYGGNAGASDIVTTATAEIGEAEGAKYYEWYGFDGHVEWCACFVSWVADQCGVLDTAIPKFAVVDDAVTWYQNNDKWLSGGSTPMLGDIVFFDWNSDDNPDHVGIVTSVHDGVVYTVEGNMGDSPGVVGTRETFVASSIIYGYGTPDYVAGGPSIYSVLVEISNKLDNLDGTLSSGDTVTVTEINNYDFSENPTFNDIYNVATDTNLVDVTKQGTSVFGKLLKFLYRSAVSGALNSDPVGSLSDFYLDDSAGVDVWALPSVS